jgi:hypothetical protein
LIINDMTNEEQKLRRRRWRKIAQRSQFGKK